MTNKFHSNHPSFFLKYTILLSSILLSLPLDNHTPSLSMSIYPKKQASAHNDQPSHSSSFKSPHHHLYVLFHHLPPPRTKIANDHRPHLQPPRWMTSFTRILPRQNLPPFNPHLDLACHPYQTRTFYTIRTKFPQITTWIERTPIRTNTNPHTPL